MAPTSAAVAAKKKKAEATLGGTQTEEVSPDEGIESEEKGTSLGCCRG